MTAPPTLPTCCSEHRIAGLELLDTIVANDAAQAVHKLIEAGWEPPHAVDAARLGYLGWLLGHVHDAAMAGIDIAAVQLGVDPAPEAEPMPCQLCAIERSS